METLCKDTCLEVGTSPLFRTLVKMFVWKFCWKILA